MGALFSMCLFWGPVCLYSYSLVVCALFIYVFLCVLRVFSFVCLCVFLVSCACLLHVCFCCCCFGGGFSTYTLCFAGPSSFFERKFECIDACCVLRYIHTSKGVFVSCVLSMCLFWVRLLNCV